MAVRRISGDTIRFLKSKPLTLTMSRGPRLDDSQWHSIEVRQELKV